MVYNDTSKSATFEDVRNAYHSLDKSLNEICEHILSIEDELREAREALARERRYREFLERMLGYGVSSIVFFYCFWSRLSFSNKCYIRKKLSE